MRNTENLILTGFMGTGKTVVGRQLARRLGREFVDMDALLEAREGMAVNALFAQRGEAHFRRLEASLCHELAARSGLVIATGGGALIPDDNREILQASGPVVCLTASPAEILRRLKTAGDRPLLDVADRQARIAELLAQRAEAYARLPYHVDTNGLAVAQVADRVLAEVAAPNAHALPVHHPGGEYTIHLGRGLLAQTGSLLRQEAIGGLPSDPRIRGDIGGPPSSSIGGHIAVVTNPTVEDLHGQAVTASLEAAGFRVTPCLVPDGETYKTLDTVRALYDRFIDAGLDRHGEVLALGGGVVGDMAGLAAATYLRGISLAQLPTTLLAMVDASVGGKVAVDHPRGKNLIGAFKQPRSVIADPDALSTLPAAQLANGLAEVVKTGLIGDPALLAQIEAHGPAPLPWLVERSLRVKIAVVEEDPYEEGRRAVLNLGHTFGHALERLSDYRLSHGEGVGIGLVAAARLSARLGYCDPALGPRLEAILGRLGLPTTYRGATPGQVWEAMSTDKKRQGTRLRFVLPRAAGDVLTTDQVPQADVLAVLEALRRD